MEGDLVSNKERMSGPKAFSSEKQDRGHPYGGEGNNKKEDEINLNAIAGYK